MGNHTQKLLIEAILLNMGYITQFNKYLIEQKQ